MKTHTHPTRCATAAIAAVLALGSTPLLAQTATADDPVTLAPVTTARAAPVDPAPVVVVPVAAASVTPSATPVVQPVAPSSAQPVAAHLAVVPKASASPARTAVAPKPAARAVPVAVKETAPVASESPVAIAPSEAALAPVIVPAAAVPAADNSTAAANERDRDGLNAAVIIAGIVGLLLLLGLALLSIVSRRRNAAAKLEAVRIVRPIPPRVEPAPVAAPFVQREELIPAIAPVAGYGAVPVAMPATVTKGALPCDGASVPLPRELPASYEERDALLKRMINARPDRANPFTNRGARVKRARLILQSLGRTFENEEPWIDLSQYPNNWPELARKKYPQAA